MLALGLAILFGGNNSLRRRIDDHFNEFIRIIHTMSQKRLRNREFLSRGYYVDADGKNKTKIQGNIKHQLGADKLGDQLSLPYQGSPFTGCKQ